ncbi:hypothetical protein H6A03_07270 [[Clostridium] spiroforme]|nr:hypothetical protein [Thomasclavelia spiroformis]MBM6879550.1 hypothetical protein [Thomasclavelia spiroformis]
MNAIKRNKKDRSTVDKKEYIVDHIFYGALFGYNIIKWLPTLCPIAYYHQSILRLVVCMLLTSAIGVTLTYKCNRTYWGTICDICSGLGLYTLLTLGTYKAVLVKWTIGICLLFTLIGAVTILKKKIKNKEFLKRVIRRRLYRIALLAKRNIALLCAVSLVIIPVSVHFTSEQEVLNTFYQISGYETQSPSSEYTVIEVYGDKYRLSENIDTIKLIRHNDTFQALNYEEKCEVVEALLYCEARYLGLCQVNLEFKELKDSLLGQYDHQTKTIIINSKPLKDGTMPGGTNEEVLGTVVHECRHCYQELLSNLYANASPEQRNLYAFTSEGVAAWIENYKDYDTVTDENNIVEYLNYRNQALEQDARRWEKIELIDYFYYIDELTGNNDRDENTESPN